LHDNPSLQELLEVQEFFGLPSPALVEKDWYVVKALAAIVAVDIAPFRLVFGGGTALSRAHGLIRRMSEDIDLKIVADAIPTRGELRALREKITQVLLDTGFKFDPNNKVYRDSANASRYTIYRLPYAQVTLGEGVLRPEIQIETAFWPLRLQSENYPVRSFVAEAYERPAEVTAISCVSITETAAEKFVALTRRAGAELADAGGSRDATLVRHIYDLHMLREHFRTDEVVALAKQIMNADAADFGHQFPAYREDPIAETIRAVEGLGASREFSDRYNIFLRDMVYGEKPEFETAIATIQGFLKPLSSV
jgi:predicted nucleotidyltransferase component of viral defense system